MCLVVGWSWFYMKEVGQTNIDWGVVFHLEFYKWLSYAVFSPVLGMMLPESNLNIALGIGIVFVLWALFLFFRQVKYVENQSAWAVALLMFGGMLAITIYRGEAVLGISTYATRYICYGVCLMPSLYVVMVQDRLKWVRGIGYFYGAVCVGLIIFNFWGNRFMESVSANEESTKCIFDYYKMEERPKIYYCTGKYWKNIAPKLDKFEEVYLK